MQTPTAPSNIPRLARLTGIQSKDIPVIWGSVSGFIEAGMDEGESLQRIKNQLLAAKAQLWIAYDEDQIIAACVSEIIELPTRKVFNVFSIGGSRIEEWIHHLNFLETGARERGCTAMRHSNIRKGFQKLLSGYSVTQVTVEKEL